jgi:hypothetical protein
MVLVAQNAVRIVGAALTKSNAPMLREFAPIAHTNTTFAHAAQSCNEQRGAVR